MAAVFVSTVSNAQSERPIVLSASVSGNDNNSRIVIDFDSQVVPSVQLLDHPWRLVLDFDRLGFGFAPKPTGWTGFTKDIRWGDMSEATSRIIFEMEKPFKILNIENVKNTGMNTHRFIIDLEQSTTEAFRTAVLDKMRTSAVVQQSTKGDRLSNANKPNRSQGSFFLVVLDAGHGGIDSGAVGKFGTLEKNVTLRFAERLKSELEQYSGVDVLLTRTTDVFVPLSDRVRFARQNGASLFLSVHADSVDEAHVRGSTVYTISDEASDDVAAQIAESENKADAIAGIAFDDEPGNVSDILVDLARRETLGFSVQFARIAVDTISEKIRMIRNPHRFAGFKVLRAPDVPSVLIELGFLSNEEDEKLLNDAEWREKTVGLIAEAIERFALLSGHQDFVLKAAN
ncbi:MAG: N-acetylmuramoyl-L-alanine amidase [Ahrensia sp.]|nr:N-acetylmuramoyl-L-alanine amidase [Ahrensia sp.]